MFFYSPSQRGFFHTDINPVIPTDAISLTEAEYVTLLNDISTGKKEIVVSDDNIVSTQDKVVIVTWDDIRVRRNKILKTCDYTQVSDWPGDKSSWASYRQQLRDITNKFKNPEDVVWPEAPGK